MGELNSGDGTSNYYQILGVSSTASTNEIKEAFRKLSLKYHPDKNPGNEKESTPLFQELKAAFETLSDSLKRTLYDLKTGSKKRHQERNQEGPWSNQQWSSSNHQWTWSNQQWSSSNQQWTWSNQQWSWSYQNCDNSKKKRNSGCHVPPSSSNSSGFHQFNEYGPNDCNHSVNGTSDYCFNAYGSGTAEFKSNTLGDSTFNIYGSGASIFHTYGCGDAVYNVYGSGSSRLKSSGAGDSTFNVYGSGESEFVVSGAGDSKFTVYGSGTSLFKVNGAGDSTFTVYGMGPATYTCSGMGDCCFTVYGTSSKSKLGIRMSLQFDPSVRERVFVSRCVGGVVVITLRTLFHNGNVAVLVTEDGVIASKTTK